MRALLARYPAAEQTDTSTFAGPADTRAALSAVLSGFDWDYSTGALTRTLMHHLHRLSGLLGRLPVLKRIVDALGRMEAPPGVRGDVLRGSSPVTTARAGAMCLVERR